MELFAISEVIPQEIGTVAVVIIFVGFLKWAIDKVEVMMESIHVHHTNTTDKLHSLITENTDALHDLKLEIREGNES